MCKIFFITDVVLHKNDNGTLKKERTCDLNVECVYVCKGGPSVELIVKKLGVKSTNSIRVYATSLSGVLHHR